MRAFRLYRIIDETGVSGTGIVAEGVEFHDLTVAMRWTAAYRSTCLYDRIEDVEKIHGHNGSTRIDFLPIDERPRRSAS